MPDVIRAEASTVVAREPTAVFEAATDPTTYPEWLVGAQEIRAVDPRWPEPGSEFHHRVGLAGPVTVADSTKVLAIDPPRCMALEVRARPFGRGRATFWFEEVRSTRHPGKVCTMVRLDEEPLGVVRAVGLLLAPFTRARNQRSLHRLRDLLEHGPR